MYLVKELSNGVKYMWKEGDIKLFSGKNVRLKVGDKKIILNFAIDVHRHLSNLIDYINSKFGSAKVLEFFEISNKLSKYRESFGVFDLSIMLVGSDVEYFYNLVMDTYYRIVKLRAMYNCDNMYTVLLRRLEQAKPIKSYEDVALVCIRRHVMDVWFRYNSYRVQLLLTNSCDVMCYKCDYAYLLPTHDSEIKEVGDKIEAFGKECCKLEPNWDALGRLKYLILNAEDKDISVDINLF